MFYLRYQFLNGDETIRALTAVRLLEGGRLYVDVVTDKPPGATFFYALCFSVFGRSMAAVHLAAWIWNFLTALIVYVIGARLLTRGTGIIAAALFVFFSASYLTQDMMAANTEMLMAMPYSAAFLFFVLAQQHRGEIDPEDRQINAVRRYWLSVGAGLMTGVAIAFKQVGVFILLFFVVQAGISAFFSVRRAGQQPSVRHLLIDVYARLAPLAVGVFLALVPIVLWLNLAGALREFWRNSVRIGAAYVGSLPPQLWLRFFIGRFGGYVIFNAALWMLAIWAVADLWKRRREIVAPESISSIESSKENSVLSITLWAAVSLIGLFAGGRFFGHYFFGVLPALSLLGARGLHLLMMRLRAPEPTWLIRATAAVLVLSVIVGLLRFHNRTAVLAYETLTGTRSRFSDAWGMTQREREAEDVAQFVRENIGEGEPLYIWGFSLDVYWRTRCRPASRFLTPNYVAGNFYPELSSVDGANDPFWRNAREQLIADLRSSRPKLILNTDEALYDLPFPEVAEFIRQNYSYVGQIGSDPARPFLIFRLKEKDKRIRRAAEPESNH